MRVPDAAKLLDVWERGLQQPSQRKVLGLLEAALPDLGQAEVLRLTIGTRDACLLELRSCLFGPDLEIVTACPACGERLEASLSVSALRVESGPTVPEHETLSAADCMLRFRLPAVADMLVLPAGISEERARWMLFERCLLEARGADGNVIGHSEVPDEALQTAAQRIAELDPQADIILDFNCTRCNTGFAHVFDIAGFLVKEVHAWAQRILRDINALAQAYGWSEPDILALSPVRRQIYLDMIRP